MERSTYLICCGRTSFPCGDLEVHLEVLNHDGHIPVRFLIADFLLGWPDSIRDYMMSHAGEDQLKSGKVTFASEMVSLGWPTDSTCKTKCTSCPTATYASFNLGLISSG